VQRILRRWMLPNVNGVSTASAAVCALCRWIRTRLLFRNNDCTFRTIADCIVLLGSDAYPAVESLRVKTIQSYRSWNYRACPRCLPGMNLAEVMAANVRRARDDARRAGASRRRVGTAALATRRTTRRRATVLSTAITTSRPIFVARALAREQKNEL
jgi:hypothetical protein